ncbi:hypothetical protein [Paracidovorax anthurii]|uniref:hypothetical protein n=1 Tax=Paracidovorax anthurii TaxID=78229 RepID=UPI0011BE5894|nr:hypothetical protein [Paracidovorax anthurii]
MPSDCQSKVEAGKLVDAVSQFWLHHDLSLAPAAPPRSGGPPLRRPACPWAPSGRASPPRPAKASLAVAGGAGQDDWASF